MNIVIRTLFLTCCLGVSAAHAENYIDNPKAQMLIDELVKQDSRDRTALEHIFSSISKDQKVLDLMDNAPERKADWGVYRQIFLNDARIALGRKFLRQHQATLSRATAKYGIPTEIITAILGIETYYGKQTGGHNVIRSLATLAFDHPRRHRFFRSELVHFLRFTDQQNLEPLELTGSYAGAMGIPQFMPSSYVHYAVDFDDDGDINIWEDEIDAIGSVANYLSRFGWIKGLPVAYRVYPGDIRLFKKMATNKLKPSFTSEQVAQTSIRTSLYPTSNDLYAMLVLTGTDPEEYWIATKNFYVISRYNPSYLYTTAVTQLAQNIASSTK